MIPNIGGAIAGGASIAIVISAIDNFTPIMTGIQGKLAAVSTAMIGVGVVAGVATAAMIKGFANVEEGFSKVNTLLDEGQDAEEIFGQAVQDLNTQLGNQGNQLDALDGLYQTISAGITDTAEATTFMNVATKSAVGGHASMEQVILAGTKTLAAYNISVEDSEKVFDLFAGTVKAGQTTMEQLASAFPTVSGMAAQAGVTLEETLGTFAGLTKVLGSAEEATTALSATIRAFIKPTESMNQMIEELGYDSAMSMIEAEGLNGALRKINDAVDGDTEALAKMIPNVRALKAVFPMLGMSAEAIAESIDIVTDSSGMMQKQFEDVTSDINYRLGVAISELQNKITGTGGLGEALALAFVPILEEKVLPALDKMIGYMQQNPEVVVMTAQILLLVGALGLLFKILVAISAHPFVAAFIAIAALVHDIVMDIAYLLKLTDKPGLFTNMLAKAWGVDVGRSNKDNIRTKEEESTSSSEPIRLGGSSSEPIRLNDFILRPNGQLLQPNSGDTIIGTKGGLGMTVNIENVYGVDPDQMSEAIQQKLNGMIRL